VTASMARDRLRRLTLPPTASLLEALRVIDEGGFAIAFVRDRRDRIVGTLTDGDVRRALLAGHALGDRVVGAVARRGFTAVTPAAGRTEVLDLMRSRSIEQVPVLDRRRRLAGLHDLKRLVGGAERPNWAVVMAGGRGQRLRPLTDRTPKPMLKVAGRPILERIVLHLVGHGIRRIFLSVHHLAHVIEEHFGDGDAFGCQIDYLREREPLGTGGPLALLPKRPRHPIVAMNGDLVTQFDVAQFLEFHTRGGFAMTFGVRPWSTEVPFGVASVKGKRLVALAEKPTLRMLVNAGLYAISPDVLRLVPRGKPFPLPTLFDRCVARGLAVGACPIEDEWADVGHHEELRRARGET